MSPYFKRKIARLQEEIEDKKERVKRREKKLVQDQKHFDSWIGERLETLWIKFVQGSLVIILISWLLFFNRGMQIF